MLQASPSMVHFIYWLIPLSSQYAGHHLHLYVFTFSNYFLSSSLTVFVLPEFSSNHSILFLLYFIWAENRFFCLVWFVVVFFLTKETHYLICSRNVIHSTLLLFHGPGSSPALFFYKYQWKWSFLIPHQFLWCASIRLRAFLLTCRTGRLSSSQSDHGCPLSPPLLMGVTMVSL